MRPPERELPESRAVPAPTGTVTFLFSDIEGSTQRWDRDRAAMQDAVRLHDAIMRESIAGHEGYVFKTIGDAFCAAFARPEDAVGATLAAQRALVAGDFQAVGGIRVRMALHTGTADERDGDYFGPAVNRVARLLAVGHGGQVLVSGVTAELARGMAAGQTALRDLGEHRLKDLSRSEHVHQLIAPDLPADFPPLRSLETLANNLPRLPTSFIGRDAEVAEIAALLAKSRLVTVVGSGGIGKTRAVLQVAANLLDDNGDGVWFVELAPLSDDAYVPSTIATALGLTLPNEGEPLDGLVRLLANKHALLVFDNCEHVIGGVSRIVSSIIRQCPRIAVLASSRQGLGIAGEATYRLAPFALPPVASATRLSAADARRSAAVLLFVERARSADQRFELNDENASVVVDICRRLDGIALAIELAASRIKMLGPRQLRDRLHERFRVLTGGNRDALPRQQTLRALIDWSYDLLDDRERALFRRLSVFVDGFTMEGATVVGSGDDLDEFDVFDVLASLVDKSLVLVESGPEDTRYRLLESPRAYAREKLSAASEDERCARLHLRYLHDRFVALKEREEATADWGDSVTAFATELEDVRGALDFGLRADVRLGATLLGSFNMSVWGSHGLEHEMVARAQAYLAVLDESEPRLHALLYATIASAPIHGGRGTDAIEAAERGLAYARRSDDAETIAINLLRCAQAAFRLLRFEDAERAIAEAEALFVDSPVWRLRLLEFHAQLKRVKHEDEASVQLYEKLVAEQRRLGASRHRHMSIISLAEAYHKIGNTGRSIELANELLSDLANSPDRTLVAQAQLNVAAYLVVSGNHRAAVDAARRVIELLAPADPSAFFIGFAFESLALARCMTGHVVLAAMLAGYARAKLRLKDEERDFTERTTYDRLHADLAASLAPAELERLLAEGAALTPEAAIELALDER